MMQQPEISSDGLSSTQIDYWTLPGGLKVGQVKLASNMWRNFVGMEIVGKWVAKVRHLYIDGWGHAQGNSSRDIFFDTKEEAELALAKWALKEQA